MEEYNTYIKNLKQKLRNDGFEITRKISIPPYQLDLLAIKISRELSKFASKIARIILVTPMEKANTKTISDFSTISTKYAIDKGDKIIPTRSPKQIAEWEKNWEEKES